MGSNSDINLLVSDFFMSLVQAFDDTSSLLDNINSLEKLTSYLDAPTLEQAFEYAGVATVRRRRLPLGGVALSVIGMGLFGISRVD